MTTEARFTRGKSVRVATTRGITVVISNVWAPVPKAAVADAKNTPGVEVRDEITNPAARTKADKQDQAAHARAIGAEKRKAAASKVEDLG